MTDSSAKTQTPKPDVSALDELTAGAFSAATASERAQRLNDWLSTQPSHEQLQMVFSEMSHRDKGAAKLVREMLDEARKAKDQDALVREWVGKGEALRDAGRINLADAMAWQREAAKAGAPLSREPLAALKNALAERIKAIEDLQHQAQVQREVAVLLSQRIEVLSTKPWQDALAQRAGIQTDLDRWSAQAQDLTANAQWASVDPKFTPALQTSAQQVRVVWEAFCAALALTEAAAADASAPLPAVPAWADQIRLARGDATHSASASEVSNPAPSIHSAAEGTKKFKPQADKAVVDQKRTELAVQAEALFKPAASAAASETNDATPNEAVVWVPVMTGRKLQESLRQLREQWKKIDKEAAPNPALWKRFDTACNRAHEVVDAWLKEARAQTAANKAQRLALIEEVKQWTVDHANGPDWKTVARQLHQFAQRWREAGHLSEKMFAEMQPVWKATIHAAHLPLEAAQKASLMRRQALIAEAQAVGAATPLRLDAVKDLQHRWQEEAHTVVLDRKQEQKLWDAFRQPIDEAFARKSTHRQTSHDALTPHDKAVVEAAKALEAAVQQSDAQLIRAAMQTLDRVARGETASPATPAPQTQEVTTASESPKDESTPGPKSAPKAVIAVRGDDRPGQKRTEVTPAKARGRDGKPIDRFADKSREDKMSRLGRDATASRAPRLGDQAFRLQRHALEQAQTALRKLASQAHGEVITQLLHAWEKRDAEQLPPASALSSKLTPAQRQQWSQAIAQAAQNSQHDGSSALMRLEVAADLSTPAAHMDARRALQLQLLTRRNDPAPAMTWVVDVAQVLTSQHGEEVARRLQAALKVLLKK